MEKQFVPYELALKLKELGFNENCIAFKGSKGKISYCSQKEYDEEGYPILIFHNNNGSPWVSLPLWQQAFDWFREKYEFEVAIHKLIDESGYMATIGWIGVEEFHSQVEGNTYEEARQACLERLIDIIEKL